MFVCFHYNYYGASCNHQNVIISQLAQLASAISKWLCYFYMQTFNLKFVFFPWLLMLGLKFYLANLRGYACYHMAISAQ